MIPIQVAVYGHQGHELVTLELILNQGDTLSMLHERVFSQLDGVDEEKVGPHNMTTRISSDSSDLLPDTDLYLIVRRSMEKRKSEEPVMIDIIIGESRDSFSPDLFHSEHGDVKRKLHQKNIELRKALKEIESLKLQIRNMSVELDRRIKDDPASAAFSGISDIPNTNQNSDQQKHFDEQISHEVKEIESLPASAIIHEVDSPFSRRSIEEGEIRVENLRKHLTNIVQGGKLFCKRGQDFSDSCSSFSQQLMNSWGDVESEKERKTSVSLEQSFSRLGSVLSEVRGLLELLMLSFEQTFLDPLVTLRDTCSKDLEKTKQSYRRTQEAYESYAYKFLQSKSSMKQTERSLSNFSSAGSKTSEEKLEEIRIEYDKKRFDHVENINDILVSRKLDAIEFIVACLYGFLTYFHSGYEMSKDNQVFAKKIQVLMLKRKEHFATRFARKEDIHEWTEKTQTRKNECKSIDIDGYLYKKGGTYKAHWKKRWFCLERGDLRYYRSEKDLEPVHILNVLLCSIRPLYDNDRKYCFEIVSPNSRNFTLQAECERDYYSWIDALKQCIETLLVSPSRPLRDDIDEDGLDPRIEHILSENIVCTDCCNRNPEWALINLGIVICVECSGVHRSLGVQHSKVRSLLLDSWTDSTIGIIEKIGNQYFNSVWENDLGKKAGFEKPCNTSTR